jgi:sphingomyelin phosphodiesterase
MEGTQTVCNSLVCCTLRDGQPSSGKGARRYGEYSCDLPFAAAQAEVKWLNENLVGEHLKPDLIIWTGDSISHDVRSVTEEHVYRSIQILTDLLRDSFPDVPILVSLGNHDFHPANVQAFDQE